MTTLSNKQYSGHHNALEEERDQRTHGKDIWKNVESRFQVQLEEDGGGSTKWT